MRAALDDLAVTAASQGGGAAAWPCSATCWSSGPRERDFHVEIGSYARQVGVDLLVTVGPLARSMASGFGGRVVDASRTPRRRPRRLPGLVEPGDVVLVKASRGVGLELVCAALAAPATA